MVILFRFIVFILTLIWRSQILGFIQQILDLLLFTILNRHSAAILARLALWRIVFILARALPGLGFILLSHLPWVAGASPVEFQSRDRLGAVGVFSLDLQAAAVTGLGTVLEQAVARFLLLEVGWNALQWVVVAWILLVALGADAAAGLLLKLFRQLPLPKLRRRLRVVLPLPLGLRLRGGILFAHISILFIWDLCILYLRINIPIQILIVNLHLTIIFSAGSISFLTLYQLTECYFTLELFFGGGSLHLRYHFRITFPRVLALVIDVGFKEIINFHIFKLVLLGMFLLGQWLYIINLFQYFGISVVFMIIGFSRWITLIFTINQLPGIAFIHIFNVFLYFWNAENLLNWGSECCSFLQQQVH